MTTYVSAVYAAAQLIDWAEAGLTCDDEMPALLMAMQLVNPDAEPLNLAGQSIITSTYRSVAARLFA